MKKIEIPVCYLPVDDKTEYDFDYMRILFEKQLELLFHLKEEKDNESLLSTGSPFFHHKRKDGKS